MPFRVPGVFRPVRDENNQGSSSAALGDGKSDTIRLFAAFPSDTNMPPTVEPAGSS